MIKNHHLLHLTEKEEFLKNEKLRIGKLYSKKHRKGFSKKDEFVKWFENTIKSQNFKCYYCDTSIFEIRSLIDQNKLKTRKTGYGRRGHIFEINRKINSNGYTKENCVLSCYYCNNDKSYILDSEDYKKYFGENRKKYFEYLKNKK
ncbi:hypothetical protein ES705_42002 [subsurface metagenome]|jgi:5-methylcytosine-specific restriction endonuclease McrA